MIKNSSIILGYFSKIPKSLWRHNFNTLWKFGYTWWTWS